MRKRTRILAMLLTVLMVVGILPLSLFALDSEPAQQSGGVYAARDLEAIQREFEKDGAILGAYQNFEALSDETFQGLKNAGNQMPLKLEHNTAGNAVSYFNVADQMPVFNIKEDGTNKALYLKSPEIEPENAKQTFIQFMNTYTDDGVQDTYISLDIKMDGERAPATSRPIFSYVYRTSGPNTIGGIYLKADGGIYLDKSLSEDSHVGNLSQTEYTRLTMVTDRATNRYFFYINDVLVNDGGTLFIPDKDINNYNTSKTAQLPANALPLEGCRVLTLDSAYVGGAEDHDGLWFDNLTYGYKFQRVATTGSDKELISSDFSAFAPGSAVAQNAANGEIKNSTGYLMNGMILSNGAYITGSCDVNAVVFVDENDDGVSDSIGFKKPATYTGQGFFDLVLGGAKTGTITLSMKLRQGADGVFGAADFIRINDSSQSAGGTTRRETQLLSLQQNGDLKVAKTGAVIGKVPAATEDKDVKLTLEVATNGASGMIVYYYIDDVLVHVAGFGSQKMYTGGVTMPFTNFKLNSFRIYSLYTNQMPSIKDDDLHIKDISVTTSTKYDEPNGRITAFGTFLSGFITKNGTTRYYDGAGGYMTEDFVLNGNKYMVGENGAIIGKTDAPVIKTHTIDEVKTEFAKEGLSVGLYQTFTNWSTFNDGGANKTFAFADVTGSTTMINFCTEAEAGLEADLRLKNYRGGIKVVTEEDGNKALFVGPAAAVESGNDAIVDIMGTAPYTYNGYGGTEGGNATHDLYASMDLKMEGVNVAQGALIDVVYRPPKGGSSTVAIVYITVDGSLFIGNKPDPDKLIGRLSNDYYTRIAVVTERATNKFYIYINDVLANPNGDTLFTSANVTEMNANRAKNTSDYTVHTIPINNLRIYNRSNTVTSDVCKGMYFDNFLSGTRVATTAKTTVAENLFTSDFSAFADGTKIPTNEAGGPTGTFGTGTGSITGSVADGVVVFVDEDGDTTTSEAIEFRQYPGYEAGTTVGEGWINTNFNAGAGQNLRFSMDVKAGPNGWINYGDFFYLRDGSNYYWTMKLSANGDLEFDSKNGGFKGVITNLSTDVYHNITVEVICNTVPGMAVASVYVDGVCLVNGQKCGTGATANGSTLKISFARLVGMYNSTTNNPGLLNPVDLRIKNITVDRIASYDSFGRISVFEQKLEGLYGIGGIFRYYNGDSTYKTADYTADGVKFAVGYAGEVLGRESDAEIFAPYAPYVDWAHEGTMLKEAADGSWLKGAGGAASTIGTARDGERIEASVNGETAFYYNSYFDYETGTTNDHSTYIALDFTNGLKNSSVVIDLDVMMGEFGKETNRGSQPLLYLRGQETSSNGGGRKDLDIPGLYLDADGWLCVNEKKVTKVNATDFTRLSFVIHGPQLDAGDNLTSPAKVDIYANGVLVAEGLEGHPQAKYLQQVRFLKYCDADFAGYFKDMYMYDGTKPQQFVDAASKMLTTDQTATPATPADMKQGFVRENGIARYYDELGLPILGQTFTVGESTYTANANGAVPCDGVNHLAIIGGVCVGCGARLADVLLYGNSLVLGSDVKVKFYLDILESKVEGMTYEFGLARDFALELETKQSGAISDLTPITINGRTLYEFVYTVTAKDIYSTITLKLSNGDEYTYSAAKYAEDVQSIPTNAVYTAELKELAKALLAYGKNAAAVLADQPAADIIEREDLFDAVPEITVEDGDADYAGYVKLKKFTLELKSNIKLKVYFTLDSGSDYPIEEYAISVRGQEVTPVAVPELGENVYCIEATLVAADLDEVIIFAIIDPDETGMTFRISAIQYAKIMANSTIATDAEKNLMKAIKLYSDAANAYADVDADNRPM